MNRSTSLIAFLLFAALIFVLYCLNAGQPSETLYKPTGISGGALYVKIINHNTDIKLEYNDLLTHFNPINSTRKNKKVSSTPFLFMEQPFTFKIKKHIYFIKNLLIHFGRKAIFFPFHYFW